MKRIISLTLALTLILLSGGCAFSSKDSPGSDVWFAQGRYLESKNGDHIIIMENQGPVVMNYNGELGEKIFDLLSDGDEIEVSCGNVLETYPGQMEIFELSIVSEGSINDIDKDTLSQLREMGWVN